MSESEIAQQIATANARLKAQSVGLKIERDGERLRLRGTFPPKPDSNITATTRQRLYPNIRATINGVRLAEQEALKVRLLLDERKFQWEPYLKPEQQETTLLIADWIDLFQEDYFNRRRRDSQSETTWRTEYQLVFKRLPQNQELTAEILQALILKSQPDSKTRKRYCICLGALAKFAKLDFNARAYAGDYNPRKVVPRDIPTDEIIVKWFDEISNPPWRWIYGMMATFGLRNHEIFRLDLEDFQRSNICSVLTGKTGARRAWAFHPEWVERFCLYDAVLPPVDFSRSNSSLGHDITQYFYRHKFPFPPYSLRHAWAIRTLEYGLDISLAAQQMGHSLKVHSELYHHWISDRQHQRAYELLLKRKDRPLPPELPHSK